MSPPQRIARRFEEVSQTASTPIRKLSEACEHFLLNCGLEVKIRHLPAVAADGESVPYRKLSSCHFVVRQRLHVREQMLRVRSFCETDFNLQGHSPINVDSPFTILRPLERHDKYIRHVEEMFELENSRADSQDNLDAVWISVHSKLFKPDGVADQYPRSKLVAWALLEGLESNEVELKALYTHPGLSAGATSDILEIFLPRVIAEGFQMQIKGTDRYADRFFFAYSQNLNLMPRQAALILMSHCALGRHCDDGLPGHLNRGEQPASECRCAKLFPKKARKRFLRQLMIGTDLAYAENVLVERVLLRMSEKNQSRLQNSVELLMNGSVKVRRSNPAETADEIRCAELTNLSPTEVEKLLDHFYFGVTNLERLLFTPKLRCRDGLHVTAGEAVYRENASLQLTDCAIPALLHGTAQ